MTRQFALSDNGIRLHKLDSFMAESEVPLHYSVHIRTVPSRKRTAIHAGSESQPFVFNRMIPVQHGDRSASKAKTPCG